MLHGKVLENERGRREHKLQSLWRLDHIFECFAWWPFAFGCLAMASLDLRFALAGKYTALYT